tara:strand:- start:614 stop:1600 length:987 start_codon:yes stop_codon:yes gene_type:complete
MKAMVLEQPGKPLVLKDLPVPEPREHEVRLKVHVCGVCRTDLHIVDGELDQSKLPLVLGHQVVGLVDALGDQVTGLHLGDRVGVPWLGSTCGQCSYCLMGSENLCDHAVFTGYKKDGGYAEYTVAHADFCFPIPDRYTDVQAAPLLCAGLIGFRAYRLAGNKIKRLGLYGFGAAAHIMAQLALSDGCEVYAFTRSGDDTRQNFARKLGVVWAGASDMLPPEPLDAVIVFAPVGSLVPAALKAVRKGGVVVCAGIHMSDIPSFPYKDLWEERVIRSVANLTRKDGVDFFEKLSSISTTGEVSVYPLDQANQALEDLRMGAFCGSAVLAI